MDIVKKRAYEIIQRKGYTNFGVAMAVAKLIQCVIRDEKKIFSVSVEANQEYNLIKGTVLSLPCIIGNEGIELKLSLSFDKQEEQELKAAAKNLDSAYTQIKN
ncbi:hypothetical protein [Halarcobacter anaerophilus]|uniref:hypothetical protein n=1 Tax=Halarcobacter anaerophilus TaxID=877500 RepID=UPI000697FAAB|nr:hypothetical protein [Halarcobacter anaerophilus]